MTLEQFNATIQTFLQQADMSPSRFGLTAVNDPSFVHDVKDGRRAPTLATVEKVMNFISCWRPEHGNGRKRRDA